MMEKKKTESNTAGGKKRWKSGYISKYNQNNFSYLM